MTAAIHVLREALLQASDLDPSVLDELESHYRTGDEPLVELFQFYGQLVPTAPDPERTELIRSRLLAFLVEVVDGEKTAAVRGMFRARQAKLLLALGERDVAVDQFLLAFEEVPVESVLQQLSALMPLEATPGLEERVLLARHALANDALSKADAAENLGRIRLSQGQLDDAKVWFEEALAASSDSAGAVAGIEAVSTLLEEREAHLNGLRTTVDEAAPGRPLSDALFGLAQVLLAGAETVEEGFETLRHARVEDAGHPGACYALMQQLIETGDSEEVAAVARSWRDAAADDDERLDACVRAGLLLLDADDTWEVAVEFLSEAYEKTPLNTRVVDGLDRCLCLQSRYEDALEVLQSARRASQSRSDERRWLAREAEIVWRHLGEMERAEKMFRRVRASEPRNMTALLFYEDHLAKKEDWKRLHAVLSQKFTLVPEDERVAVAIQMAELAEQQMANLDKAIEAYKRALKEDADNLHASEQLVRLYQTTRKWHALIEFLNGQIRRLPEEEGEKRVALLFQIIDVYQDPDKLPVEEMVIHTYNRVVQVSPTNVIALDSLAQRYEDSKRWAELVQVLRKKIEATTDAEVLLDLFHQVADHYLSKMSNETQAVPFLEKILELDTTNLAVVRKLRNIYKAKHNLERLYGTYAAELQLLEGESREPVLTELAVLATDKLYWRDAAIGHWQELLELNPRNEKAVNSLQTLFTQEERWEDMVSLLKSRLEQARTKRRRVETLQKLGQILFEQMGAFEEAKNAYRQVLEINSSNTSARRCLQKIHIAAQEWEQLKTLFAEHQDWAGYVRFLDESRATEQDHTLRTQIQLEVVRVLEDKLSDADRAIERLESVLVDDPQDAHVAQMLEQRYSTMDRSDDRLRVLAVVAEFGDVSACIAALDSGAALLGQLGRTNEAFEWACRAAGLALDQGDTERISGLEAAAEEAEQLETLAQWYGDAAARVSELDHRKAILRLQATLIKDQLRQNAEAIVVFEELAELDFSDLDVLHALEILTSVEKDWSGLERALTRQITVLERSKGKGKKKRKADLWACRLKLAELYEDILEDPDRAVDTYAAVLSANPGDEQAFEGLDRIYQREERWDDLLQLLRAEVERVENGKGMDPPVALLVRVAEVLFEPFADIDAAIERACVALGHDAQNDAAVSCLLAMFEAGHERSRIADLLIPILRETGNHGPLEAVLVEKLLGASKPATVRKLQNEIATLREGPLEDAEGAFEMRFAAVALIPSDADARAELERLSEALGRWERVANLYACAVGTATELVTVSESTEETEGAETSDALAESAEEAEGAEEFTASEESAAPDAPSTQPLSASTLEVARVEDTEVETILTRRLAEIYEAQLEDLQRATDCYQRVLGLEPANMEVLGALERLHARQEDWEALLEVYCTKVELLWEAGEKKAVYLDICQLLREELARPEDAIEYYSRFLALDEGNLAVIAELEALYTQFNRWEDYVGLLRRRLSLVEDAGQRVAILFQLARVYRDQLERVDEAIVVYASILEESHGHEPTVDALEGVLLRDDLPGFESFAIRAADLVQPLFQERNSWEREIGVLQVRAELAVTDAGRAEHLRAVGALQEQNESELKVAFSTYAEAFRLNPSNQDSETALQRVAVSLSLWAEWVGVLEEGVRADEPAVAVPLLMKIGAIVRGQLENRPGAIEIYRRVLDFQPLHSGALRALDELYEEEGQSIERVRILERRAEVSEDESERRTFMFTVGRIQEEQGDLAAAIEGFAFVVEHGDAAREEIAHDALERLQALYLAGERWLQLVNVYLRKAEIASELEESKHYIALAAELQEHQLESVTAAVDLYERIRAKDPFDSLAFDNLSRLLSAEERWDDLDVLLLDCRARTENDDDANRFDFMLGQLYENRLDRCDDAVDRYEAILHRSPDFSGAIRALESVMAEPEQGLRASAVLVDAHAATDNPEALSEVLRVRLHRWRDEIDASATHRTLAGLCETRFDDLDTAFDHVCQASLLGWSEPPELRAEVVRLAGRTGRWEDLEGIDRSVLDELSDIEARLTLLMEMARVALDAKGDPERAEAVYREALDEQPGHLKSLEALRQIYETAERHQDLADVLRVQADFTEDAAERIAILYHMGYLQQHELAAGSDAVETYERILAEDPQEWDAYTHMVRVHEVEGDWQEVISILRRRLDVQESPTEIQQTRQRIAALLLDELGEHEGALNEAVSLLELNAADPVGIRVLEACHAERVAYERVLDRLITIYESAEQWDKLIALYRSHVEQGDRNAKVWALERIQTIQRSQLEDPLSAFETQQEIAWNDPSDQERWTQLEDVATALDCRAALLSFYAKLIEHSVAQSHTVSLALRAAHLNEEWSGPTEEAIRLYRVALEQDATNETATASLTRLFNEQSRWEELVQMNGALVDELLDGAQRETLLFETAKLYQEHLDNRAAACEALRRVLDDRPDSREALARLEALYIDLERWDDVDELYRQWMAVAEPPNETTAVRYRLAAFMFDQQKDIRAALDELRRTLQEVPTHRLSVRLLERMLGASDREAEQEPLVRAQIADLLEDVYSEETDWRQWVEVRRAQVAASHDSDYSRTIHTELGRLYQEYSAEPKVAFQEYSAAFAFDYRNQDLESTLESLAEEQGFWQELVSAYMGGVQDASSDEDRLRFLLRIASIQRDNLEQPEESASRLEEALALEPGNEEAYYALRAHYSETEKFERMVLVLETRLAAIQDATEQVALLFELAQLHEGRLASASDACAALERVLDVDPVNREAFARLEGLLRELERAEDVEELYRRWLGLAERPREWSAVQYRLAEFLVDVAGDSRQALDELRELFLEDPAHALSVALVERMLKEAPRGSTDEIALRSQIADLLEEVFSPEREWDRWVEIHRAQLAASDDFARRKQLHTKLGMLYLERANESRFAFEQFSAAFGYDYGNPQLEERLEDLAAAEQLWTELVEVYEAGLADAPSEAVRTHYLLRSALLYRDELGRSDTAASRFEQALESDPSSLEAFEALAEHYETAGAPAELIRVLQVRLDSTQNALDRISILYQLADLELERLENPAAAVEALQDVLSLDRSQGPAKDKLERLYSQQGEWDNLVQVYRWRLEETDEEEAIIELLQRIAQIQERELAAPEDAVQSYRELLDRSPQNLYALTSLERLYPVVEDYTGLLDILERKRSLFAAPRDRVGVDFKIGTLFLEHLPNPERALEHFRLVLQSEPEHAEVIECLEKLLAEDTVRVPTSMVLEHIYLQRAAHGKLASLLELQLQDTHDETESAEILRRLGGLKEQELSDRQGALDAYGRAFVLDPQDSDTRKNLIRVAELTGNWQQLADVYREVLGARDDVDVIRDVGVAVAVLLEERLHDAEAAIDQYRDVLGYDEFNAAALSALSRLLEQAELWDELVDIIRRELAEASGSALANGRRRLAKVLLEKLGDYEGALETLKEVLWAEPSDSQAIQTMESIVVDSPFLRTSVVEILKPIYQGSEQWNEVVRLLQLGLDEGTDPNVMGAAYAEIAAVYEQHLDNPSQACDFYMRSLRANPDTVDALPLVEHLAAEGNRWADLLGLYEWLSEQTSDERVRAQLLVKAGRLATTRLERPEAGEPLYRQALEADSENYEALQALEQIYEAAGRHEELIEICERKAGLPIEVSQRIALYRKVAEAAQQMQDLPRATENWLALLELNGADLEALAALEALYSEQGDAENLAETLDRRAEVTEDQGHLLALKVSLGQVRWHQLSDLHGAVDSYEEALELDPGCAEALTALDSLYQETGDHEALVRILHLRLDGLEAVSDRVQLLSRMARVEEGGLARAEQAIGYYREILVIEPGNLSAINDLIRVFEASDRWEGLCDMYERKIALSSSATECQALQLKAATVYLERLRQPGPARELIGQVLTDEPGHAEALRLKARLLEEGDNPQDAVRTYEAMLPTIQDPTELLSVQLKLGKLYMLIEGGAARAKEYLSDALAINPDADEPQSLLKEVLQELMDWDALIALLEQEFDGLTDKRRQADLAHEVARIYRDRLEDDEGTYRWLRVAVDAKRDHRGAVEDLVDYLIAREEWADSEPLLAWLVSYLEAKRKYRALSPRAEQLAKVYQRLGDNAQALTYYKVACQSDSQNASIALAYGRLLYETERYDRALQTLQGLLVLQHDIKDEAIKIDMFLYLAKVSIAVSDKSKARRHLKRLLAIAPEHTEGSVLLKKL